MMSKQFGFRELEDWVYQIAAENNEQTGDWTDSETIYRFPDG